jgi:hypothetical protein
MDSLLTMGLKTRTDELGLQISSSAILILFQAKFNSQKKQENSLLVVIWTESSGLERHSHFNLFCSSSVLKELCSYIKEKPIALFNMV